MKTAAEKIVGSPTACESPGVETLSSFLWIWTSSKQSPKVITKKLFLFIFKQTSCLQRLSFLIKQEELDCPISAWCVVVSIWCADKNMFWPVTKSQPHHVFSFCRSFCWFGIPKTRLSPITTFTTTCQCCPPLLPGMSTLQLSWMGNVLCLASSGIPLHLRGMHRSLGLGILFQHTFPRQSQDKRIGSCYGWKGVCRRIWMSFVTD